MRPVDLIMLNLQKHGQIRTSNLKGFLSKIEIKIRENSFCKFI